MRCEHCDTRLNDGDEFRHRGFIFCTECVSALASWLLDGGTIEAPEMFEYVLTDEEKANA